MYASSFAKWDRQQELFLPHLGTTYRFVKRKPHLTRINRELESLNKLLCQARQTPLNNRKPDRNRGDSYERAILSTGYELEHAPTFPVFANNIFSEEQPANV